MQDALYLSLLDQTKDPRQDDWLYMASPVPMILCTLSYLLLVLLSPAIMRHVDKPPQIRGVLIFYNLAMVIVNGYIAIELFLSTWAAGYSYTCQPVSFANEPLELRVCAACYLYTLSKPVELLDTVFLIIRKKFNQMSFLHVYHHAIMVAFIWMGQRYAGGSGMCFLVAMLNSFVHCVMYGYYGLAAVFPGRNFWWKKYLTVLQMSQFVLGIYIAVQMTVRDCPFPPVIQHGFTFIAASFLILFLNFWYKAYNKIDIRNKLLNACFPGFHKKKPE